MVKRVFLFGRRLVERHGAADDEELVGHRGRIGDGRGRSIYRVGHGCRVLSVFGQRAIRAGLPGVFMRSPGRRDLPVPIFPV